MIDHLSETMKEHAFLKVERLARYHNRISRVQIIASHAHDAPEVEMIVHVDSGRLLVARERGKSFSTAMDKLAEKMERQLKKDNEKRKQHRSDLEKGEDQIEPDGDNEDFDDAVRKDLSS